MIMNKLIRFFILGIITLSIISCAESGTKVNYSDPGAVETVNTRFGSTDLHLIAEKMVNSLIASPVLDGRPIIFVDDIRNKTLEHIDTKSISDKIRTILLKNGRAKITARSDISDTIMEEQGFQSSDMADPKTIVKMGKLAGAKFILYGEITSIVKRANAKTDVWYKITLNLSNVQDGLIEWADDQEIRKVANRRTIGW